MNISLIGPYGVGKGTQVNRIAAKYDLLAVSPGDVFKLNIKEGTGLGLMAKKYVDGGELVPDEIADAMVEAKLRQIPANKGVVFDGFPRTTYQAHFLDSLFKDLGRKLDTIIYLLASEEEIVKRLSSRLVCKVCQKAFDRNHSPFISCPFKLCLGEHLSQAEQDKPEIVKVRQRVFQNATGPLIDYYSRSEKLAVINGEDEVEQVFSGISRLLDAFKS